MPSVVPTARVWSYGYNSAVFSQSLNEIDLEARSLLDRINGTREDSGTLDKPIIFVAHSLGGIVVKKVSILLDSDIDDDCCSMLMHCSTGPNPRSRDVNLLRSALEPRSCHCLPWSTPHWFARGSLGKFHSPASGHDTSARQQGLPYGAAGKLVQFPRNILAIHSSRIRSRNQDVLRVQDDWGPDSKFSKCGTNVHYFFPSSFFNHTLHSLSRGSQQL